MTLDQLNKILAAGEDSVNGSDFTGPSASILLTVLAAMTKAAAQIEAEQPVAPWRTTQASTLDTRDLPYAYSTHSPQSHHVVVRFDDGTRADHFVEWFNRGDWEDYQKWHAQQAQAAVQPETAPFEMPPVCAPAKLDEWRPGDLTAEILPPGESKGIDTEVMPVVKDTRAGRRRRSQTGRDDA